MMENSKRIMIGFFFKFVIVLLCLSKKQAFAHCDTLDGPVIQTAKIALVKKDATPVLKWVKKKYEQEILDVFQMTLNVREKGEEAKKLADRYFFETLVRVHREGEGAPYTGLKPAGSIEPAIAAADKSLEIGTAEALAEKIGQAVRNAIQHRFAVAMEKKAHEQKSINAGREYVEAYVEYIHFVEGIHQFVLQKDAHHHGKAIDAHGHN